MIDISRLEADVAAAPREQIPDLIGLLARLQARAQLRMFDRPDDAGQHWVGASTVLSLFVTSGRRLSRRTLYERAPSLGWARRTATGKGWEFELSAARRVARGEVYWR